MEIGEAPLSHGVAAWGRWVAACSPFGVAVFLFFALRWSLIGPFAIQKASAVLFLSTVGLLASAHWLSKSFLTRVVAIPFYAAVAVVWLGWTWQRLAFIAVVPHDFLQYGYFLTPTGRRPRLLVLELPLYGSLITLGLSLCFAIFLAWRAGARWSLVLVVSWWLVTALVFCMPSLNLSLQGDAAIFI